MLSATMSSKTDFDNSSVYSKELIKNTHHFLELEVVAKTFSIAVWLTFPIQIMMIVIGYLYKNECPAEPRLARFLFFGGTAGTVVIMLRLITYVQWKRLQHQYGRFDVNTHPGLSLVQAVTYVFVVFVICLFVDATRFIFTIFPDLAHPESERFCHPNAYYVVYVLVIAFDAIFGVAILLWLTAMVLGVCNPDFLVMYGYFLDESEMKFNVREKIRKRRKKHSKEHLMANPAAAKRSALDSDEERGSTTASTTPEKRIYKEPKSHQYQAIQSDEINPNSKLKSPNGSPDIVDGMANGESGKSVPTKGRFTLTPPTPEEASPLSSRFKVKPVQVKPNPVYGFPSGPLTRQNSNSERLGSEDVAEAGEDDDDL
eukprot:TCALIF_04309-PA protein Name:"Protein of unknown function" AED:0.23 eAED:0.23 QI:0/0.6/0.33/1/0.6/0.5/6/0/370